MHQPTRAELAFDKLISIGNMSDVSFADTVEWLDGDENTSCISLYVEGLKKWPQIHGRQQKSCPNQLLP